MQNEKLIAVAKQLKELKQKDLTNTNYFGEKNNFKEAEEDKNKICDIVIPIFENASENVPDKILRELFGKISSLTENVSKIEAIIKSNSMTREHFPNERLGILKNIRTLYEDCVNIGLPHLTSYRLKNIEGKVSLDLIDELKRLSGQYQETIKSANETLQSIKKSATEKAFEIQDEIFESSRAQHRNFSILWISLFGVLVALLTAHIFIAINPLDFLVYYSGNTKADETFLVSNFKLLYQIARNIIILSFYAAFLKVCLSKYNNERNLYIIYNHRVKVLNSYGLLEAGMNDLDRTQYRLQIAKFVFTDPETGYLKNSSENDLNINPLVNITEKIMTKQGKNDS